MIATMAGWVGRFGLSPKEAERFIKFLVVGGIGFVVDFGIFNLLLDPFDVLLQGGMPLYGRLLEAGLTASQVARLGPGLAGTVSFVAAIVSNFLWNRYWTYPDSRGKSFRRQFAMFTVVSIAGIIIRIPIITLTHDPFIHLMGQISPLAAYGERLGENLALALAVLVVMFWNFFVNRYWTYSDVRS